MTHIHNLPYDILYTIFILCHEEDPMKFELTASHVCRQWRSATTESPTLWSTLVFSDRSLSWEKYEVWIARSRDAPLEIQLWGSSFREKSVKNLARILRLILPHTSRWQSIIILGVPTKILRLALDRIRVMPLPILRTLEVSYSEWSPTTWKRTPRFLHAPVLQELNLQYSSFQFSSPLFDNLTSLTLYDRRIHSGLRHKDTVALIRSFLARSPALHSLVIRPSVDYSITLPPPSLPPLVHHSLRILDIPFAFTASVLQELQAPALIEVNGGRGPDLPVDLLPAFARWPTPSNQVSAIFRGSPGYRAIDQVERSLEALPNALSVLSSLEILQFDKVGFGYRVGLLECLGSLCPRLRGLGFVDCQGATGGEIQQVVTDRIRLKGMAPLRELVVSSTANAILIEDDAKKGIEGLGYACEVGRTAAVPYGEPDRTVWFFLHA